MLLGLIGNFVAIYPIIMSTVWIMGSILLEKFGEVDEKTLNVFPKIAILLPCYNEEQTVEDTVEGLLDLDYPNYEIWMINDKSTDNTLLKMHEIQEKFQDKINIHIVDMPENGGKARGLNHTIKLVDAEYVMVVDSDCYVEAQAVKRLMAKLLSDERYAAVTGSPIIRNRTSILGKLQTLEYVGIIGNIKKAQSFFFNKIMTISGVLVIYKKAALEDIGGFDPSAMTEDINATWRLYSNNWLVAYEPNAHCYILAPESVKGLIKQRKRWAIGGLEVLLTFFKRIKNGTFGEKFLLCEMIFGYIWAIGLVTTTISFVLGINTIHNYPLNGSIMFLYMMLGLIQFEIGCIRDGDYGYFSLADKALIPIYIFAYWLVNLITSLQALYNVYFNTSGDGKWESSDRGI